MTAHVWHSVCRVRAAYLYICTSHRKWKHVTSAGLNDSDRDGACLKLPPLPVPPRLLSNTPSDLIAQFTKQISAGAERGAAGGGSERACPCRPTLCSAMLGAAQFMDHGQFIRSNVVYHRGRRIEGRGGIVSMQEAVFWNNIRHDKDVSPVT